MITFLQINLQRSATAQNLLQQTAAVTGAQVLLLSEQNWSPAHDDRWAVSDDRSCAVVLMPSADFAPESTGSGRGFAWIQARDLKIYSCYTSRNDTNENFAAFLAGLEESVLATDPRLSIVLGGDFNA